MTKDELIKFLIELDVPGDTLIILQKDGEGNGYSPLSGLDKCMYEAESKWAGQAYLTDEQVDASDYDEEDKAPESAVPAIVLWPVNWCLR